MPKKYAQPPIVEAACDFRFSPDSAWDWTIAGLLYERVKGEFPTKEQVDVVDFVATPLGTSGPHTNVSARIRLVREERDALLQLGPQLFTVNQLRPYPEWPKFKEVILTNFHHYLKVAEPRGFARIGLRYINRIPLPESTVNLNDYFNSLPKVAEPIPQVFKGFLMQVEVPYGELKSSLRIVLGTVPPDSEAKYPVLLDLDMYAQESDCPMIGDVEMWLDAAHQSVEEAFEASITDTSRTELFGEVKQ
jgi:uncharacterized protein (TIGR04255 family)